MRSRSRIRRVTVDRVDLELTESFGISGGGHEIARNVLFTIELGDGTLGYGEAAPLPPFNGETQDSAVEALRRAAALLDGADVGQWRFVARHVKEATAGHGSAQCAIETAMLDAFARQAGVPLWAMFGGSSFTLDTDLTIPINSADPSTAVAHAARSARAIAARGFRIIKTKVGGGSAAIDLDRVKAIHHAAPDLAITLDANGGFDASSALKFLESLKRHGIVPLLFEQPVPKSDLDGMALLTERSGVPIVADESADGVDAVLEIIRRRAASGINVKLMKSGIIEALDVATLARAAGLDLMIGGMVESILAMSVSACFATGLGGFKYVDLDTPMFITDSPFSGGFRQTGPEIDVRPISTGHGVVPTSALASR